MKECSEDGRMNFLFLIVPLCLVLAGCSETTRIHTTPPGAMVRINGRDLGPAPVKLSVNSWSARPNAYHYHVETPGYVPKEGYVEPHLSINRIVAAALSSCFTCSFRGFYQFDEETEIVLQPDSPVAQTADDPVAAKLRRLQNLYDQGLISADELRQYKADVLRGIVVSREEQKHEAAEIPDIIREIIGPILESTGQN